jgi:hypothetical protein
METLTKPNNNMKAIKNDSISVNALQLNGLMRGLQAIRTSNIVNSVTKEEQAKGISRPVVKLPAKVDYWLCKNEDIVTREFNKFTEHAQDIADMYALQKEVDGNKFYVFYGKDSSDVVLQDKNAIVVRQVEIDGKLQLQVVEAEVHDNVRGYFWSEVIEPAIPAVEATDTTEAVAAKEEVRAYHLYQKQFKNEGDDVRYNEEMEKAETEAVYSVSLYKLEASNLEGLSLSWPNPGDPRQNLEEFRKLIFEHAIIG